MSCTNNTDSFNTLGSFNNNTTLNVHLLGETPRTEILAWLSPLEPRIRHKEVQSRRVPGVGDWLLCTEVFQSWSDVSRQDESSNATLFCYGDPGVGKTYITSLVIDILGNQFSKQGVIVTGFYFDFAARKEQSPTDMLGALLKQVVSGLEEIPEEVANIYRDQRMIIGGRGPQLSDILKMFQTASTSQRIFICVDALDECVAEHRQEVLESLREILKNSPGIRLFLTGIRNIRSEIHCLFSETAMFINIKPNKGDIVTYILAKLERDTNKGAMSPGLKTDILTKIPAMVSGIFLVSLIMKAILREQKVSTRRYRLETAMSGSEDLYDRMLSRVKEQDDIKEEIGMAALMWVSHSERPLRVDELCHALAIEIESADLDPENIPSIGTLSDCCQGLLAVDGGASTVRLIHLTLQEHLSTRPDLFNRAHSTIAETCLTYLNFQQFKGLPASDLPDPLQAPFLGYSSIYWGAHAKRELSERAKSLALKLFDDYDGHISIKLLLNHVLNPDDSSDIKGLSSFTGLHCASFFGIVEVVAALMETDGCGVDKIDCVGNTPLMWATKKGHDEVVELLQKRGGATTKRKRKKLKGLPPPEPSAPKRRRAA